MLPGVKIIPYGDINALKTAITKNTAAFLLEPIQGEAGIVIPPKGLLEAAYDVCKTNNILYMAAEIQAGLGRTRRVYANDGEGIAPDVLTVGIALGGGVMPISCVAADKDILGVFGPGSHGSTFGGNPLACAVSIAALEIIEEANLMERSRELGEYMIEELQKIDNPKIKIGRAHV